MFVLKFFSEKKKKKKKKKKERERSEYFKIISFKFEIPVNENKHILKRNSVILQTNPIR